MIWTNGTDNGFVSGDWRKPIYALLRQLNRGMESTLQQYCYVAGRIFKVVCPDQFYRQGFSVVLFATIIIRSQVAAIDENKLINSQSIQQPGDTSSSSVYSSSHHFGNSNTHASRTSLGDVMGLMAASIVSSP